MKKLTVDEIIQGLVDGYERLLKLQSVCSAIDDHTHESWGDYREARGEVQALRWVLGQDWIITSNPSITAREYYSEKDDE